MRISLASVFAACLFLLGAPAFAQTQFVDVTSQCGLTFTHTMASGHPMGPMVGGATVGDFNNDGWPDLFVLSGGTTPDKLFINAGNGTFSDQAVAWGLTSLHYGSGACVGDYDRDGWMDLYVTSFGAVGNPGPGQNKLYRNNGNGTFSDVAAAAGVAHASRAGDQFGACFGDYDRDGWLDLFVCSYGPGTKGNRLFRNNQNGTFSDVTREAGISAGDASGFVPTFADMDGDRWPELLLIADHGSSEYYVNNGDGTFTDSTATVQHLTEPNAMGLCIADADGDLDLDFYVSDAWYATIGVGGNRLFLNQGGHNYLDLGQARGCHDDGWGWGVVDLDFDNDGWVDLGATNGWFGQWAGYPSRMFHNLGAGYFQDVAAATGFVYSEQGRSILRLDFDRDGDEDVVLSASGGPLKAFRNDLSNGNAWLTVALDSSANPALAPHGYGARILVSAGGRTQVEYIDLGQTYLGCSDVNAHFGLGTAALVDELRVEWADGFSTVLRNVAVNQHLTVSAPLPLTQTLPLRRGMPADFTLAGAEPGEAVLFLYSWNGTGAGNAVPALGGLRLDLVPPAHQLGVAVAGADGTATYGTVIPLKAPVHIVGTQAVIQRGAAGAGSVKSNAIASQIVP